MLRIFVSGHIRVSLVLPALLACFLILFNQKANSAETWDNRVIGNINKAKEYLLSTTRSVDPSEVGLVAYTLLKAGQDPESPEIQHLFSVINRKFNGTRYAPLHHNYYEAACDLMAFQAAKQDKYKAQIRILHQFIVAGQRENGSWFYIKKMPYSGGDTSITQYALLGLWAAEREGFQTPPQVWDKAALWMIKTQTSSGGFVYHPFDKQKESRRYIRHSMTVAAIGSLQVCLNYLEPHFAKPAPEGEEEAPATPYDFLEEVSAAPQTSAVPANVSYQPQVKREQILVAIDRAWKWMDQNYNLHSTPSGDRSTPTGDRLRWYYYYLYTAERAFTLSRMDNFGKRDWYSDGINLIKKRQQANGVPGDLGGLQVSGEIPRTCLCMLFMMRATKGMVKETREALGAGLLMGGRGLPDDLNAVHVKDGQVKERKIVGPLDKLLVSLENGDPEEVQEVQSAIVEKIQSGDREDLVKHVEEVKELVDHQSSDVRRTAVWVLGRSDNIRNVPHLLRALSDLDISVVVEARNGLCFIARTPNGFGSPETPLHGQPPDLSETQKKRVIQQWRDRLKKDWFGWYDKYRPYDTRDAFDDWKDN